jgi:hypothetical protein
MCVISEPKTGIAGRTTLVRLYFADMERQNPQIVALSPRKSTPEA